MDAPLAGGSRRSSRSRVALIVALWITTVVLALGASQVPLNAQRAVPGLDGPFAQEPNGVPATPFAIIPADVRTTADIVAEQRALDATGAPRGPRAMPKFETGRRDRPQNVESPDVSSWPPGSGGARVSVPHVLTPGVTIEGPTLTDTRSFPPDTMGDVGPTQYFIALNGVMRVYNKTTGILEPGLSFDPDTFFSTTVRNASGTTDPRIRYDRLSGRWFIVYITIAIPNRLVLAVSNSSTITLSTSWTFFFIANTVTNGTGQPCLADYETLGLDNSALYMGVSQFCGATLTSARFFTTSGFVANKASLLAGSGTVTLFSPLLTGGSGPESPQGADNTDPSSTTGYFVGADAYSFGKLSIIRIANPGGTASATKVDLTVPTTSFPLNAPHSGGTKTLDAIDDRLMNAVVRNGRLYTAHAIGVNSTGSASGATRDGVRWYELDSITTTPTVRQSGTIFDSAASSPLYFWLPSINVNSVGDAVVGYSASSTAVFAGAAASHRRATDTLGTMQASTTLVSGSASYNPPNDTENAYYRWGDYSMVSVDPSDDVTFWTAQMYGRSTNIYGTRALRLTVSSVVLTPPTAANDAFSTPFNTLLTVAAPGVLANDSANGGGALAAALVSSVSHGALVLNADGSLSYAPTTGYSGSDGFTYRVSNANGVSAPATVSLTVQAAPTVALPPTGLFASSIVGNALTLRWTPPAAGLTPTGYILEGGNAPGEVLASIPTGSTDPTFTFAAPTGSFFVRMHTASGANRSAPSNEIRVHVNVPVAPSAPSNLLGLVNGSSLALSWRNTFGGGAATDLILEVSGASPTSIPLGLSDSFGSAGVPAGTYTLSLRATNAAGVSPSSNAVTLTFPGACTGVPQAPASFLVTKAGNVLTIVWDSPADGPAPTGYVLSVSGSFVGSFPTSGRTLAGGVAPGSYTLSVLANNACGNGPATAPQIVTVP